MPGRGAADGPSVLVCDCSEVAVVCGIAVLRPEGAGIVAAIRRGDAEEAFRLAIYELEPRNVRSRRRRLADLLARHHGVFSRGLTARERSRRAAGIRAAMTRPFTDAVRHFHPGGYGRYLEHRFANPSLFAALASLAALDAAAGVASGGDGARPRVLDLACGTGHFASLIERLHPGSTIGVDADFLNLLLLRRYFAPEAALVCLDLESDLPFADDSFDIVTCLDAFQYVERKEALAAELDRVTRPSGGWLLAHVHNALRANVLPGRPLTPDGYRRVLGRRDLVLLDEGYLLECLHRGTAVDLSTPRPEVEVADSDALCIIGSGSGKIRRAHDDVLPRLLARDARVILNPIFRARRSGSEISLEQRWPDPGLRRECGEILGYLPPRSTVDAEFYERVREGRPNPGDRSRLYDLARRFVLVPAPPEYAPHPFEG